MAAIPLPLGDSTAVTPFRLTRIEVDGVVWVLRQGSWKLERDASQMEFEPGRTATGDVSEHVLLLPGAGWILEPVLLRQAGQLTASGVATMLDGTENADLAPNIKSEYRYRKPALSGVTVDPSVPDQGMPIYVKEVTGGQDYGGDELSGDAAAYVGPPTVATTGFDRVLAGTKTYRAGQGFLFSFWVPLVGESADVFFRFYFGGPTDTTGRFPGAGEWCVAFRGDGTATLWERVGGWTKRGVIQWAESTAARRGWAHTFIQPFHRSRIFFITSQGQGDGGGLRRAGAPAFAPRSETLNMTVHRHRNLETGYAYKEHITGAGIVRVDARQDLACRFGIGASEYEIDGTLVDGAFALPYQVPEGSVMRVLTRSILPSGTTLEHFVYDADTGTLLTPGPGAGEWLTVAKQKRYQVKFFLQSDGQETPALQSYSVELDAEVDEAGDETAPLLQVDVAATELDLLGPDRDVTHQTGHLEIMDLDDELVPLRTRARVPIRIYTRINDADVESCIYDGEATAEEETVYRTSGSSFPRYDVTLAGKWAELQDRRVVGDQPFGWDYAAGAPLTVTATIKRLLRAAGVPEILLDIPEVPLPFIWPSDEPAPYQLQPGVSFLDVAQHLAREYLDAWLVWCPNSGTAGLWRLRFNPFGAGDNILWNFVSAAPAVIGLGGLPVPALPHVPGTYPEKTTFIRRMRTRRRAPEANSISVSGLTPGPTSSRFSAYKYNPKSFNKNPEFPTADPNSLDYSNGQEIHESFLDLGIQTMEQANFLACRLLDLIGHGYELKLIDAPLFFVTDPTDTRFRVPRPLMTGDEVTVDGAVGVVQTAHIAYRHDRAQWQNLEVKMVPEGV